MAIAAAARMPVQSAPEDEGAVRVLVVEDEPRLARLLARVLRGSGYAVDCTDDGAFACELLDRRYGLVLLDLGLPGIDGFAVLDRIRTRRPGQPVLVLSASSDVESKVRCFELGASDYVTKPFALAELLARMGLRLDTRPGDGDGRRLQRGHVWLDLERHVALVRGEAIALSLREFALLEYLMRRAGRVCTRPELLAAVWGCPFDPQTNVVDVYIRRLRAKLGGEAIETVRSVGYCYRSA